MVKTVVVGRSGNPLLHGLVNTLRRSGEFSACCVCGPDLPSLQQNDHCRDTYVYIPTTHDRAGTIPALDEAERVFEYVAKLEISRLVLISSAMAYGTGRGRPPLVTENYVVPGKAQGLCGGWLRLEAQAATRVESRTTLIILRPSPVVGSGSFPVNRLLGRIVVTTPGHDPVFQLLSFDDLAQAVIRAITYGQAGVFNVAPDDVVPLHEAVHHAHGIRLPVPHTFQRAIHQPETLDLLRYSWTISNSRIKRELGFSPRKSSLGALLDARSKPAHVSKAPRYDRFGMDEQYIRFYSKTLFKFLSKYYWRIEDQGLEHVPRTGKAVLVGMHRGFMPWDGVMALYLIGQKTGRYPRFLTHPGLLKFPFLSNFLLKLGGVVACQDSAEYVLQNDDLLGIFPEGIRGAFLPYNSAYRLVSFGRDAFVKLALRYRAPIVPFVTLGSAETFPIFGKIKSKWWTRYSDWPFIPITPTFPLLPIPLPSKWHTQFLPAISLADYPPEAANDARVIKEISGIVRSRMQEAIDDLLGRRRSIFFGSLFKERTIANHSESIPI